MKIKLPFCFLSFLGGLLLSCTKPNTCLLNHAMCEETPLTKASILDSSVFKASLEDVSRFISDHFTGASIQSIHSLFCKQGKTPFYLVNMLHGWAIVTSDLRRMDVLAYSEDGVFDVNNYEKTGLEFWLTLKSEEYTSILQSLENRCSVDQSVSSESPVRIMNRYFWVRQLASQTLVHQTVYNKNHLIPTKWGQDSPWNYYCPAILSSGIKADTGCVPVAIGQVLYYLHSFLGKPSGLYHSVGFNCPYIPGYNGTFFRDNYINPSPKWNTMALTSASSNVEDVAKLLIDIGERINTHYDVTGSYTYVDDWLSSGTLTPYGISCSISDYSPFTVKQELNNNLPVIVRAEHNSDNEGHAWIIDGYKETRKTYDYTYVWSLIYCQGPEPPGPEYDKVYSLEQMQLIDPNMYEGKTEIERGTENSDLYWRMNWGANGDFDDGYYSALGGWEIDAQQGTFNYQFDRRIMFNFGIL